VKNDAKIDNQKAVNGISAPYRAGYDFAGWSIVEGGKTADYTMETLTQAPNGTTLYAVWTEKTA
jgi:uncharacterized repeat protein (TIGR02543 family)